jgi:hypothetical protein
VWMPAIVIPGIEAQMINLIAFFVLPLVVLTSARKGVEKGLVLWLSLLLLSWFFTLFLLPNGDRGLVVFGYYILFSAPLLLAFYVSLFGYEKYFIRGFIIFGFIFLAINLFQYVIGSYFLESLRNSNLYKIIWDVDRAALFFPEASGLGQVSSIWAALILFKGLSKEFTLRVVIVGFGLYLVVLLSTKSLSSLGLLVFLLFAVSVLRFNIGVSIIIKYIILISIGFVLFSAGLDLLYQSRGDGMLMSLGNRFSTIVAVCFYFFSGELGEGFGGNINVIPYVIEAQSMMGIESYIISEGINSFFFTRLFEEGYIMLLPYILMIYRASEIYVFCRKNIEVGLMFIGSLVIAIFLSGYRAYPIMWFHIAFIFYICFSTYSKKSLEKITAVKSRSVND